MAFDNVTFFELHLDDARFGGLSGFDGDVDAAAEYEGEDEAIDVDGEAVVAEHDESRSGPRVGRAVAVLAVLAVSTAVARRFAGRRGDADETDVEMHLDEDTEAEGEPVEPAA